MTFATPLWLFALIPWCLVVLYLLWGRRKQVNVPFLDLWPASVEGVRVRRRATPPPIALAAAILATLLAILAAGQPSVRWAGSGEPITLIVDRGITMSARAGQQTRLAAAIGVADEELRRHFVKDQRILLLIVPGTEETTDLSRWSARARQFAPTALDTRDTLAAEVRARLLQTAGPVIVLSDQPLDISDDRLVQIAPPGVVRNARITLLAARDTPKPQVMVRVRGQAGFAEAKLRVSSGGEGVERDVQLTNDADTDAFIDLPQLGEVVKAELIVDDDQPVDNTAWLVREQRWPRVELRTPMPAHLQRMFDVYARQRPADGTSKRVVVVRSLATLPAREPGVVVALDEFETASTRPAKVDVSEHPVTRGITGSAIEAGGVSTESLPAGWTPVISAGGKTWVAVREQPTQAVWVGFDTSDWARSSEFVVFWDNVLGWTGSGGEQFAASPVGTLDDDAVAVEQAGFVTPPALTLWPGLYRRSDGTLAAVHAPPVRDDVPSDSHWREKLQRLDISANARRSLAPHLVLAALSCLGLAAWTWKRRDRQR